MTARPFRRLTRAEMDSATAQAPPHYEPILTAVRYLKLAFLTLHPGDTVPPNVVRDTAGRPMLMVLGDDPPNASSVGPSGFNPDALAAVRGMVRAAFVISAAGDEQHYRLATASALQTGCAVLIETQPRKHRAWLAWLEQATPSLRVINVVGSPFAPEVGHA